MTDAVAEPGPALEQPAPQVDAAEAKPPLAVFTKRAKNRGNLRKRAVDDIDDGGGGGGVVRHAKAAKESAMAFTTRRDDKVDANFKYESSRTLQQEVNDSTRTLDVDTAYDRDNRAIRERQLAASADPATLDSSYKGMAGYVDFRAGFRRELNVSSDKGKGSYGPLRSNAAFVRSSVRVDYQPDICKDYKETGYCGYGDSCKFMHDRGDYKMGWELEAEWDAKQKAERERMERGWGADGGEEGEEAEEAEADDGLPFACWLCRRPWEQCADPVVTKCGHHFCEHCALKHNAKSKTCAVCEQPTQGIFNVAHDIVRKVKEAKRKAAEEEG